MAETVELEAEARDCDYDSSNVTLSVVTSMSLLCPMSLLHLVEPWVPLRVKPRVKLPLGGAGSGAHIPVAGKDVPNLELVNW